jgi:tetratricopeptide (TPR) repeat protein
MLGCLAAVALGGPLGIVAWRRQLERERPRALCAWARAALVLAALEVGLFAGSSLRTALASPCSPSAGLGFLPVLALPSALLATALGVFCGTVARGRLLAGLLYAAAALGSLGVTLASAYAGPSAYALDHLFGWWPGPIYDEAIRIDERLLLFRLGTLAWAAALLAAPAAFVRPPGRPAAVFASAVLALVGLKIAMVGRGHLATRAGIAAALGGSRRGPRCDLHFPREKPAWEADRLFRDCELSSRALAEALGIARPPRVAVWVYRSPEEKRRLVGAGRTSYTKPWLAEIHVNDAPAPHPVLRHELVHALAASFAPWPLRVPARAALLVEAGLVEGLAVAVETPRGEWTAHEWARAMRDLGLMPRLSDLVGAAGFAAAPPARAYVVAGSFLRFLLDRHGAAAVRRIYGGEGFERAFGEPLHALEEEWSAFLDGVAVPAELRASAEARFRREGLFSRRCAREVADLEASASEAAARGDAPAAAALWRRAAGLSGDAESLRAGGDALRAGGDLAEAAEAYRQALLRTGTERPALRAALESDLGDLFWRGGAEVSAAARYRAALALDPERAEARLLRAKLAALGDPALAEAAGPWLLGLGDPAVALSRLSRSPAPLARYLLGRALLARGAPRLAVPELWRASSAPLPDASFAIEARRLLAEARCAAGEWDDAIAGFEGLARDAERAAVRERARDAAERCRAERLEFGRPVEAPGDWPPGPPRGARRPPATVP